MTVQITLSVKILLADSTLNSFIVMNTFHMNIKTVLQIQLFLAIFTFHALLRFMMLLFWIFPCIARGITNITVGRRFYLTMCILYMHVLVLYRRKYLKTEVTRKYFFISSIFKVDKKLIMSEHSFYPVS